jgi:hypothetical protein
VVLFVVGVIQLASSDPCKSCGGFILIMASARKIWSAAQRIWFKALPSPALRDFIALAYPTIVFVSLLASVFIWSAAAVNKMFYCSDSCGPPFDFIPPFVHDSTDHYIASPFLVWTFWGSLLAGSFVLPAVVMLLIGSLYGLVQPGKEPPTN